MQAVVYVLVLPVIVLNMFGGIVGYVWLAILGQWKLIGIGLIALFISTMWLGIALAPGLVFSGPGIALITRRHYVTGGLLMLIGEAWTYAGMFVWCAAAFLIGINAWDATPSHPIYPFLLWIYATATGPFTYAASRESESLASLIGALSVCVGMAIVIGLVLLKMARPELMVLGLVVPMIVALVLQAITYVALAREGAFQE